MAILEPSGEHDLSQLWDLINQLSLQLNDNRKTSVSLYGLTGKIKNEAINSQTGFVLRRYNMDKTKEEYEAELENMNAAMSQENRSLQHDNKQLNALIKEYEQTLESLMSAFRNRAKEVQERELSLIREHEVKLMARDEENSTEELIQITGISNSLAHLSHLLRQVFRAQNGENTESSRNEMNGEEKEFEALATPGASDHALERDIELSRLEKENEELRRLIGLLPPQRRSDSESDFRPIFERPHPIRLPSMQRQGSVVNLGKTGHNDFFL